MRSEVLRINSLVMAKDCATQTWIKLMATPHGFILLVGNYVNDHAVQLSPLENTCFKFCPYLNLKLSSKVGGN